MARINKLDENMTLAIEVTSEFRFRLWVAKLFLRLAALTLGCSITIDDLPIPQEVQE